MVEKKQSTEAAVHNIRRKIRKKYSTGEKTRIVLYRLSGDITIAELCRRDGINQNLYYKWSKEFLEAGKMYRQATNDEVKELHREMEQLKLLVAELSLKNRVLKKSLFGLEGKTWKVINPGLELSRSRSDCTGDE